MEAIWQEQNLSIDEEQAKAEMEQVKQEALRSGEELDEGKLAAQVFEAMKASAQNLSHISACLNIQSAPPESEQALMSHSAMP